MKIRNGRLEQVYKKDIRNDTVKIPQEVKTIGNRVFSNIKITHITIPETVEVIEYQAFADCKSLKSVIFTGDTCLIGAAVFLNCEQLIQVQLPLNLHYIFDFTFQNCNSLKAIYIPATVRELNVSQFFRDENLEKIIYKNNIYSYQDLQTYGRFR